MCAPLCLAESFCSDVQESGLLDYCFYRVTLASSWRMAYRRAGREWGALSRMTSVIQARGDGASEGGA